MSTGAHVCHLKGDIFLDLGKYSLNLSELRLSSCVFTTVDQLIELIRNAEKLQHLLINSWELVFKRHIHNLNMDTCLRMIECVENRPAKLHLMVDLRGLFEISVTPEDFTKSNGDTMTLIVKGKKIL